MDKYILPSFGKIESPEDLYRLIESEAMSNGNLSIRGVARMADVDHKSISKGGDFNSKILAQKLTESGFCCGDLIENGFPPAAVILVLEYFAYESKAKAHGAKMLMRIFGAFGLKSVLEKLGGNHFPKVARRLPERDSVDYANAAAQVHVLPDGHLKRLIQMALVDDLELRRNNALVAGGGSKPRFTIVKVRAKDLGYSVAEIGSGSDLGRFVAKRVKPAFKESVGNWSDVNHFEVTPELDSAIHAYFNRPRQLGFGA